MNAISPKLPSSSDEADALLEAERPPVRAMTLRDLAAALGASIDGDPDLLITGAATVSDARPGDLVRVDGPRWLARAETCPAAALLAPPALDGVTRPCLRVADPRLAFGRALGMLYPVSDPPPGIHPTAVIEDAVAMGEGCSVMAHAFVGAGASLGRGVILHPNVCVGAGARVGDESVLFPNVTLYPRVVIGRRVRLHAGSVVGADGFGYVSGRNGHEKIPHVGTVVIEDDVEIGANATVDRASTGVTRIGAGTKIDNQVQIGHNCRIGRTCLVVAMTAIGGSTKLGDGVVLGGHVGVSDNLELASGVQVAGFSGVWDDQQTPGALSGSPARPHRRQMRIHVALQRLPELIQQVADLAARLARLEAKR